MPDKTYDYYNFPEWIDEDWMKFYDLARSYGRAILILLDEEVGERSLYSERDIFPVLTFIHIYLELIFKSLILNKTKKLKLGHDLISLRKDVKEVHPKLKFNSENEKFIGFLSKENPNAEAFRYGFNKVKNEYFVCSKDVHKGISLSYVYTNAQKIISVISEYFETILPKH